MYRRVLNDELMFDDDTPSMLDPDTKSLIRGLLQKDPALRIGDDRIKKHKYFEMIDFTFVYYKRYIPPYIPTLNPDDETDTSYFDTVFLEMAPQLDKPDIEDSSAATSDRPDEKTDAGGSSEGGAASKEPPLQPTDENGQDVFDGYSFGGRDPDEAIVEYDDEEDAGSSSDGGGGTDDEAMDGEAEDREAGITSSSMQTASTAPASIEKDAAVAAGPDGSVKDNEQRPSPSTASRHRRDRKRSVELASLMETDDGAERTGEGASLTGTQAEEDDDWDMVETPDGGAAEERNGTRRQGNTLWARGVRDRYRLRLVPAAVRLPIGKRQTSSQNVRSSENKATASAGGSLNSWDWAESRVVSRKSSATPLNSGSETPETPPKLFSRRSALLRGLSDSGLKGSSPKRSLSPHEEGGATPTSVVVVDTECGGTSGEGSRKQSSKNLSGVLSEDEDALRGSKSKKGSKIKRLTFQGPLSVFQGRY
jgi:serine/threonine protein kinase